MSRISVQNVSKQFGSREIFKDLSFDIEENEFVAFIRQLLVLENRLSSI